MTPPLPRPQRVGLTASDTPPLPALPGPLGVPAAPRCRLGSREQPGPWMRAASQAHGCHHRLGWLGTPPCSRLATRYAAEPREGRGPRLRAPADLQTGRRGLPVLGGRGGRGGGDTGVHPSDPRCPLGTLVLSRSVLSVCVYD